MIVSKCPVRISIAGGSTDLEEFINSQGRGSVVSFSANLYTYISVFRDKFGQNFLENKYNISYAEKESVLSIDDIENDLAKVVLRHFSCRPLSCWFTADVSSAGSGLASSSSYMLSFLHAINRLENIGLSKKQIIEEAWRFEKLFNPLTGFQDPYGCATGGLNVHSKKINENVTSAQLDDRIFDDVSMYLLPSSIKRKSTQVLSEVKKSIDPRLLNMADDMVKAISSNNFDDFIDIIKTGWVIKKESSPVILGNDTLRDLDSLLYGIESIDAHRLIGAGNGGYFLLVTKNSVLQSDLEEKVGKKIIPVSIDNDGLRNCE